MQAAAAVAPPLATLRQPLPRRHTVGNDHPGSLRRLLLRTLGLLTGIALVLACFTTAQAAGSVTFFTAAAGILVASACALVAAPCGGAGNLAMGWVAALSTALLVGLWLGADAVGPRAVLSMPWLAVALLLYRGAGERLPRALLWWPALLTLAAVLLWSVLLLTVAYRPAAGTQWSVFAGWPWPHCLGAVRGNVAFVARDASALVADYAVMLGVAAALLWRRPLPWLVRWLPRLAAALAVLHLIGGFRLALATDG